MLKTFLHGDFSALRKLETQIFHRFSFPNFSVGSVFPVTHPRFCFNINVWLCLKHLCVVTFLHSENWRHKFSIDSVFQTFPLVQFSPSPILGLFNHLCVAMHKTFMRGDLSAPVKSAKKICQNRLTHLCVAVVNHLGNSSSHQQTKPTVTLRCVWITGAWGWCRGGGVMAHHFLKKKTRMKSRKV